MCSLVFCKITLFSALLQREKMFCKAAASHADFRLILLGTKIGFFELYIGKGSVFPFCLLKHIALTQRSVCHKVVLFAWLLHGKKVFFQFAASHPCCSLDFTQNHVFSCDWLSDDGFAIFWLGYVVLSVIFVRRASIAFSLFNC